MKKIKEVIYNYKRRMLIKSFVTDIGEIIEEQDRLICMVSQDCLDKLFDEVVYSLSLNGVTSLEKDMYNKIFSYGLNKPVYYIFDGINFDKTLEFYANSNTYVIFRNCIFRHGVYVYWADDVTFENNSYYYDDVKYSFGNTFLYSLYNMVPMINDLRFINDNLVSLDLFYHPTKFGLYIYIDNLEIIDTKINLVNEESSFSIKAVNTKIINSLIDVSEFYLDFDRSSKIKASNGIIIDNFNGDLDISNIETPYLVYNGVEVNSCVNEEDNKYALELRDSRNNFISTIRAILDECLIANEEKISEIRNSLENRTLRRVLKK